MEKNGKGDERIMKKVLIVLFSVLLLSGCSDKTEVYMTTGEEVRDLLNNGAILIDVRTEAEYNEGHIEGAINIPHTEINTIDYAKDKEIIVYCKSGGRSSMAANELIAMGYKEVYDLGSIENY